MLKKQNIIFDLDGTIIDSQEGIVQSVRHALTAMGIPAEKQTQLTRFIGPPLLDSFQQYYGMNKEQATKAVVFYREYFHEKGLHQHQLYPGIKKLIEDLANKGKNLAVATTKPRIYAVEILDSLMLSQHFSYIAGSHLDGTLTDKSQLISLAMKEGNFSSVDNTVMVGDTRFDIIGANQSSMESIGVLYGFGTKDELEEHHPTALAKTTNELRDLLLA